MSIELLNGAFVADFEKGKKGKPGKWNVTAVLSKIGKKPEGKESLKERPQYKMIEDIEAGAKRRFERTLKEGTLNIVKYLKSISR